MRTTFATWPLPVQGRVVFTAPCPCGRDALWEQDGCGPGGYYHIACSRRSDCLPR
jgi:hypothetical protein